MRTSRPVVSLFAAASLIAAGPIVDLELGDVPVTSSRVDSSGDGAWQYRVPALAVDDDGALVACYDSRNASAADLPSNIDVVCRRSDDDGRTWDARAVAATHTESDDPARAYGVGDANLLHDEDTGRLFLSFAGAPPGVGYLNAAPSARLFDRSTLHPWVKVSDDGGRTWSKIIDLTEQLKSPDMAGVFASSGKGLQLADGTLVVPYLYRKGGRDFAAYGVSADHGATWRMTAPLPGNAVNEHKVEQLPDGSLVSYGRPNGGERYRMLATAPSIDGPWTVPAPHPGLPDPAVNGDILRVDPDPDSPRGNWLLSSNPDSQTTRSNLVVRLSKDGGRTWPWAFTVQTGPAGYSTMVRLADGSFAVLYEHRAPDSLVLTRFGLDQFPSGGEVL